MTTEDERREILRRIKAGELDPRSVRAIEALFQRRPPKPEQRKELKKGNTNVSTHISGNA